MMLLQAGQMGLYRRESIWTGDIPPDMVAGATLWIDGTDSSVLFEDIGFQGSNVAADGADVFGVMNKVGYPARRGMSEIYEAVYDAAPCPPSLHLSATPSGKSALGFGALTGVTTTELVEYQADTDSWTAPTDFVTTTQKLFFVAAKIAAAAPVYNVNTMDQLVGDRGRYMGLYVGDLSGTLMLYAYNYSTSNPNQPDMSVSQAIPRDEWIVMTMQQQSGQLRLRVNGGAWQTAAIAATDHMPLGLTTSIFNSGAVTTEIAHIAAVNTAQTDAAISAVEHWIANDLGITPWW